MTKPDFTPVTSSWYTKLPPDHQRIGISRGTPRGQAAGFRMYRALAPGKWFRDTSPAEYKELYFDILAKLNPHQVLDDLLKLAGDRVPVMVCFEPPYPDREKWCHRSMVSAWFKDTIGLDIYELGQEHEGCGWAHPKMPPPFRRRDIPPVDRGADIAPLIGKMFKHKGKAHQVVGVDPDNLDQALVTDGKRQFPISADLLLEIAR